jgi:DNA-binding transcriptional LysR family regulator
MELNSIEAIKNAVQSGLGASFVSISAIEKELQMGVLHRAPIEDVVVKRLLSVIVNPHRYRSKAAEAFSREILPEFACHGWQGAQVGPLALASESVKAASSHTTGS